MTEETTNTEEVGNIVASTAILDGDSITMVNTVETPVEADDADASTAIVAHDDEPQRLFDAIVQAIIAQGAFEEDAPVMLRALLEELQDPSPDLAAIIEAITEETKGEHTLFELVAAIKRRAADKGIVQHTLFRKHDAAKAFNCLVAIEPEKLQLDPPTSVDAEVEPEEPVGETITTEELLRERPLEWRATEIRNLRVGLHEDRVAELQNRLAHAFAEMSKLEEEKEDFDKAINKRIKSFRAECDIANLALKEGEEEAPVTCRWRYDYTNGVRDLIRLDTNDIVETQNLSAEERQARFEFEESNEEPEPAKLYNHVRCNVCGWVRQVSPTSDLAADESCASCGSKAVSLHGEPVTIEEPELEEEPSGEDLADELENAEILEETAAEAAAEAEAQAAEDEAAAMEHADAVDERAADADAEAEHNAISEAEQEQAELEDLETPDEEGATDA